MVANNGAPWFVAAAVGVETKSRNINSSLNKVQKEDHSANGEKSTAKSKKKQSKNFINKCTAFRDTMHDVFICMTLLL